MSTASACHPLSARTEVALDLATATPQADTVTLDAQGKSTVYLNVDNCAVQLYAQR